MFTKIFKYIFLVSILITVSCTATARRGIPYQENLSMATAEQARGKAVFNLKCSKCHPGGKSGLGPAINDKPLPGFLIRFQVRNGLGAMPAFSKEALSDRDLDAVVSYLLQLRKEDVIVPDNFKLEPTTGSNKEQSY